ncbi:MAG: ATP-binding cassette domain-containing protein [Bacteroidales bacterium]|jgi:cell division transport system ATP-binding protein|nr:ATP-binding cassette domain-containing protein [Bacteroidales bacterium]
METVIQFENADICQREITILSGVTFEIQKGEFVYLIGKTASGKSSLLKTIYADLPLKRGFAMACGYKLRDIKRKNIPFLRRKAGVVFQDFQLLADRTLRENLLFVLRATQWNNKTEMEERIKEVLAKVCLRGSENKMPHQLSGGEQQRAAIARALLNDPELIIADEPTGNLDPAASTDIMDIFSDLSAYGMTVFMATHNYNLIKEFPARVLRCREGKLDEIAPFVQLDEM